jgi:cytoskeletal protein CcmA (bactofilin family)
MFLKGKKQASPGAKSDRPEVPGSVATGAGAAPAKRQPSGVPSIVSADLRIEGNLHSIGDVQIDGVVNGDISSKTLTVGEGAEVHGAIEAESLRICGTVEGEVTAKTVILTKTARVYGDVLHESLSVEAGALIHGFSKRSLPSPPAGNGFAERESAPVAADTQRSETASTPAE